MCKYLEPVMEHQKLQIIKKITQSAIDQILIWIQTVLFWKHDSRIGIDPLR